VKQDVKKELIDEVRDMELIGRRGLHRSAAAFA
jgi:hypothetical protein